MSLSHEELVSIAELHINNLELFCSAKPSDHDSIEYTDQLRDLVKAHVHNMIRDMTFAVNANHLNEALDAAGHIAKALDDRRL